MDCESVYYGLRLSLSPVVVPVFHSLHNTALIHRRIVLECESPGEGCALSVFQPAEVSPYFPVLPGAVYV